MTDQPVAADQEALVAFTSDLENLPNVQGSPLKMGDLVARSILQRLVAAAAENREAIIEAGKQAYYKFVGTIDIPLVPEFAEPAIFDAVWVVVETLVRRGLDALDAA